MDWKNLEGLLASIYCSISMVYLHMSYNKNFIKKEPVLLREASKEGAGSMNYNFRTKIWII